MPEATGVSRSIRPAVSPKLVRPLARVDSGEGGPALGAREGATPVVEEKPRLGDTSRDGFQGPPLSAVPDRGGKASARPTAPVSTISASRWRSLYDEVGASFALSVPPTADDLERWAAIAAMPNLAGATWTARPGPLVIR